MSRSGRSDVDGAGLPARGRRAWWLAAASLAIVAVVAALVLVPHRSDAPGGTTRDGSAALGGGATTVPDPTLVYWQATVSPVVAEPGDSITVTPSEPVSRLCDGFAALFADSTEGRPPVALLDGSDALRLDLARDDCGSSPSASSETYRVPLDLPAGKYVICLTDSLSEPGCGVARVEGTQREATAATDVLDRDVDVLAGWPATPARSRPPGLDDVPRLLFSLPEDETDRILLRSEGAGDAAPGSEFVQTWASTAGSSLLVVTTRPGELPSVDAADDEPVTAIGAWDHAVLRRSAEGIVILDLADPSGTVDVWATGWTRDDVVSLASTLTRRSSGEAGWDVAGLAPWVRPVHEGWTLGVAWRGVRWVSASGGSVRAELQVLHGVPSAFRPLGAEAPLFAVGLPDPRDRPGELTLRPALVYELDGRVAIAWSPGPDLTAIVGVVGTVDDALMLVRGIGEVDEATWDALALDPSAGDGCWSMFC